MQNNEEEYHGWSVFDTFQATLTVLLEGGKMSPISHLSKKCCVSSYMDGWFFRGTSKGNHAHMATQVGMHVSTCGEVDDLHHLKELQLSLRWLPSSSLRRWSGRGQGWHFSFSGLTPRMQTATHGSTKWNDIWPRHQRIDHILAFWKQNQNMFPSVAWLAPKVFFYASHAINFVCPLWVILQHPWLHIRELQDLFLSSASLNAFLFLNNNMCTWRWTQCWWWKQTHNSV